MRKMLLTTLAAWLLLLIAPGTGQAQQNAARQASASLECLANQPICAGETASLLVALEGQAPYSFRYSDGTSITTVSTSDQTYELAVMPASTRSYQLVSMQDARGNGTVCGTATVAVNQCEPPKSGKDCSVSCFDSKILEQTTTGSCNTYTLQVSNDGSCQSALSHFSISVLCGKVSEASNSMGWPMEIGTTDPTTGITGIKVDNIKGFGEDGKAGTFTVTYTVCTNSCGSQDPYSGFLVAYKAGQCVNYSVAEPPYTPMSGSLAATHNKCFGESTGTATLSLNGGKAPFTYSWSNGAATENLSGLAAGTYTLTITDAIGKQLLLSTTVNQPQALQLQATATATSCGAGNGSLDLTATGGTGPYTYSWSNGAASQDISNLSAGTYSITVKDANNCIVSASYTIAGTSSMQVNLSGGSGGCTASAITATVNGGTAPYHYSWNTGETSASITPTTAGTYTLTVTDASGCTATASTTTSSSSEPIQISYEYSTPSCSGSNDGWIDVNVYGGSAPYSYSWNNSSTTEDLENIASGTYSITVTDSKGCTATAHISLPQTAAISIMATEIIQPDCLGNLGSLTVGAFNGTAPYTYIWTNGATGESLEGLEPGYYTITVTDDMGCSSSKSFQIKEPSAPSAEIQGGSCGESTLTASVSGGEGPYSYEWSTGETSGSIEATSGQYYTVIVTDQNGCTAEADMQVGEIGTPISLTTTTTSPLCYADLTGSIDLTVEGGTGTYTIVWSDGTTSEDLTDVSAGTYSVVVTDESGCIKTATVTIASPAAITITATEVISANCHGPGGITVEAQSGTAPYTYTWAHGASGSSLEGLQAGQYTVTVTDAKGCTSQKTFSIQEEAAPAVSIATTGTCNSVQLSAAVNGSTGPFTYLWSDGSTSSSIIPTVSGSYSLTITDANGCQASAYTEVTIGESSLSLQAEVQAASCSGTANGSATIYATGGTAPYAYDWSNGLSEASATNLAAGVYSVKVTDARGCYDVVAFEIKQNAPLSISLLSSTQSSCGQPNGELSIGAIGGTAPYTYKWNTGATTASVTGLAAGTYTVAVIDAIGCAAEASYTIEEKIGGSAVTAWIESCEDSMIAKGSSASISVYFDGEAPYTFSYTDGRSEYTVSTEANPYILSVQPEETTTYSLLTASGSCNTGSASGSVTIVVVTPKIAVCTDNCFSTDLLSAVKGESCTTYTLQVNAGADCRYDLSHFEVAIPCGSVSSMHNSEGWPMSVGLDPTTGVWGIKVDNIQGFGSNESFTLTYTLCNTESCQDNTASCGPLVSYKAGQCVYFGKATTGNVATSGKTTYESAAPAMSLKVYPNPLTANQTFNAEIENLYLSTTAQLSISNLTGLKVYEHSQTVSPGSNSIQVALPSLPSGTYVVSVILNNTRYTKQLFIY